MRDHVVIEQLEIRLAELAIAAPPHRILGERIDDNVFVLGAAAGVNAGLGAEGAALHQRSFAASDRVLHQHGVGQIPMNASEILKAEFVGAVPAVPHARFHHLKPPLWPLVAAASRLSDRRSLSVLFDQRADLYPAASPLPSYRSRYSSPKPNGSAVGAFHRCTAARTIQESTGNPGKLPWIVGWFFKGRALASPNRPKLRVIPRL